jgi:acyl-CoA synthetase (AMP-forming)/AMP-acid ligase II
MPEISKYYQLELTMPDLLKRAIISHPDLFIGYSDKNGKLVTQTYKDLQIISKKIASGLYNLGLKKGNKVIIATASNQETVELLWGCFLLGIIPTILQPPMTFTGYNPSVVKLMNVYEQLECPYVFMSKEIKDAGDLPAEKLMHISELNYNGHYPTPILNPDDLAFIQFSSGSTGDPKGIMLTHKNLMVNMDAIRVGLNLEYPDVFGNWMPLYHDMGLIGYHLTPIYSNLFQYQIETIDFIMNPGLWLNLLSRQKVCISGCTNFGLALVLRYLSRKKSLINWDFSSMKTLLNGAEPISVKTMQEFMEALNPFGFKPEAMMPVYGMSEATLAVSFPPLLKRSVVNAFDAALLDRENRAQAVNQTDPSARVLSEVGMALNDIEIRIVNEKDQPIENGMAGHIQLKGSSITKGYYKNPASTNTAYCGEWFRTGDIGFFFEDRLYISGRFKDIIFKNGRNYFANDLEFMACTLDDIKYGKVCFAGTTARETGQDKVIAFIASIPETKASEIFRELRALMRSNLGITVDEMIQIKSNEIPKTSSGKLQRYKLMQRYLNAEFTAQTLSADKLNTE